MDDSKVKDTFKWIENEYLKIFGDLLERTEGFIITNPNQIMSLVSNPDFEYKSNAKDIMSKIKDHPDRGRGFNLPTEGFSILFIPNVENIEQAAEEIFHAMSGLEPYTEETFVPLATYLISLKYSERQNLDKNVENVIEKSIGKGKIVDQNYKFPRDKVAEKYKGRGKTAELLVYFANDESNLSMETQAKVIRDIYKMIHEGENAEKAIKKELYHLKNPETSRDKSNLDKIKNVLGI